MFHRKIGKVIVVLCLPGSVALPFSMVSSRREVDVQGEIDFPHPLNLEVYMSQSNRRKANKDVARQGNEGTLPHPFSVDAIVDVHGVIETSTETPELAQDFRHSLAALNTTQEAMEEDAAQEPDDKSGEMGMTVKERTAALTAKEEEHRGCPCPVAGGAVTYQCHCCDEQDDDVSEDEDVWNRAEQDEDGVWKLGCCVEQDHKWVDVCALDSTAKKLSDEQSAAFKHDPCSEAKDFIGTLTEDNIMTVEYFTKLMEQQEDTFIKLLSESITKGWASNQLDKVDPKVFAEAMMDQVRLDEYHWDLWQYGLDANDRHPSAAELEAECVKATKSSMQQPCAMKGTGTENWKTRNMKMFLNLKLKKPLSAKGLLWLLCEAGQESTEEKLAASQYAGYYRMNAAWRYYAYRTFDIFKTNEKINGHFKIIEEHDSVDWVMAHYLWYFFEYLKPKSQPQHGGEEPYVTTDPSTKGTVAAKAGEKHLQVDSLQDEEENMFLAGMEIKIDESQDSEEIGVIVETKPASISWRARLMLRKALAFDHDTGFTVSALAEPSMETQVANAAQKLLKEGFMKETEEHGRLFDVYNQPYVKRDEWVQLILDHSKNWNPALHDFVTKLEKIGNGGDWTKLLW